MEVRIGKEGMKKTWQDEFPETTECCRCAGEARIGFAIQERRSPKPGKRPQAFICHLHQNEGKGGYWLHDLCAVAVYFCRDCLKPTALYNQA